MIGRIGAATPSPTNHNPFITINVNEDSNHVTGGAVGAGTAPVAGGMVSSSSLTNVSVYGNPVYMSRRLKDRAKRNKK